LRTCGGDNPLITFYFKTLIGKVEDAARILSSYLQVLRHLGLPPEFYNIPNREPVQKRLGYPLRPEILESLMYLYKATEDPAYLHVAAGIVDVCLFLFLNF